MYFAKINKRPNWNERLSWNFVRKLISHHHLIRASILETFSQNNKCLWLLFRKWRVFILCKKCPYSEFCWSVFSHIRTKYGEILSIYLDLHSARMRENTNQKNSKYRHFSRSKYDCFCLKKSSFRKVMWTVKLFSY